MRLCLSSVLRYAPPGTEILVVDDGSPEEAVSRTAGEFPGVGILRLEHNQGFCAAVNAGIANTSGEVVELLNDDAEAAPGWADAALTAFIEPEVAAVTPLVLFGPPGLPALPCVDSSGDTYHVSGVASKRHHGLALPEVSLQPGFVFGASGSSSFFRRRALEKVGGLAEELVAYFDDVDLSFRLHRAGFQVFFEPNSLVYHRVSASYGRPADDLLALQSRNEELVFWRNLPWPLLLQALPSHVAVLLGKAARRARQGQLLPFLRGRWEAVLQLPSVLRYRKQVARLGPAGNLRSWCLDRSLLPAVFTHRASDS